MVASRYFQIIGSLASPRLAVTNEVLALVGAGLPNKLMARRLEISEKTHLTSIYRRIGVHGRTEAALWARRRGRGGVAWPTNAETHRRGGWLGGYSPRSAQ